MAVGAGGADGSGVFSAAALLSYAGLSAGTFRPSGVLTQQVSAAGVSPGATAADNVVASYSIPASLFDVAGRGLLITAFGSFANNTNAKTAVKIIVNPASATVGSTVGASGSTIATTNTYSTTGATGWNVSGIVYKYGAAGANTQIGSGYSMWGANLTQATAPVLITATESGAIFLAITANAATSTADILFNILTVWALN